MKKLMIAAAIVCAAAISQAAMCSWSAYPINEKGTSTAASGYMAYFVDSSVATTLFTAACAGGNDALALFLSENGVAATAASTFGMAMGNTADTYGNGDPVTGYLVIINADSVANATYAYASGTASGAIGGQGQMGSISFGATQLSTMSTDSYWTQIAAVPEPTSGLLLLLGVAGLALRRRRA